MSSSIEEKGWLTVLKGIGISVLVIIIGILVFSVIVKITLISEGVVKAVNQGIKIVSVFLGCFFVVKGRLGFLKGMLIGIGTIILSHLLFALFGGTFSWGAELLLDVVFSLSIGAVSGILAVNVRK